MKMLNKYLVNCSTCSKPFEVKGLVQHEILCQQSVCSNELCGVSLSENPVLIDLEESVEQVIARNF